MCLFLRARAVVKFFSRVASTLKIQMASSERFRKIQMAGSERFEYIVNFGSSRNLSFINRIHCFAPSNS